MKESKPSELTPEQQNAKPGWRRLIARIATWVVITILCLIAYALMTPQYMVPSYRSPVSKVRSDQRTLATALEAYYIDNNAYPAWTIGELGINAKAGPGTPHAAMPTFRVKQGPDDSLNTLTTPVPYITSYFADPYVDKKAKGSTFAYWVPQVEDKDGKMVNGPGWILWSAGPDKDFDLVDPAAVYSAFEPAPSDGLIQLAYDPTNGSESSGDVFRFKQ